MASDNDAYLVVLDYNVSHALDVCPTRWAIVSQAVEEQLSPAVPTSKQEQPLRTIDFEFELEQLPAPRKLDSAE